MTSTPSPSKAASVSQGVPDGWKLVPIEPMPEMYIKGGIAIADAKPHAETFADEACAAYAAMLSTSPEAPSLDATVPASGGVSRKLVMQNGDTLECDYPDSEKWAASWTITGPTGAVATQEQDWEIVEIYGLTALFAAYRSALSPAATSGSVVEHRLAAAKAFMGATSGSEAGGEVDLMISYLRCADDDLASAGEKLISTRFSNVRGVIRDAIAILERQALAKPTSEPAGGVRRALEPFARYAAHPIFKFIHENAPGDMVVLRLSGDPGDPASAVTITTEDFRRAARTAALSAPASSSPAEEAQS